MAYEVSLGGKEKEPLVSDQRLQKIFYQLQKLRDFPDDTSFATFVQEPSDKEPRRLAVFLIVSPHPRKNPRAMSPENLITITVMPHERWQHQEKEHRHYAFLSDPLRPIFAGILRRHLSHYSNLKEMN